MKTGFILLALMAQTVSAQTPLEPGSQYLVSIQVDHPEDVKKHKIYVGRTLVGGGETGVVAEGESAKLKLNELNGRMEAIITIPETLGWTFKGLWVELEDAAGNKETYNLSAPVRIAKSDLIDPVLIEARATRVNETTLDIDVLIEEENKIEGQLFYVPFRDIDDDIVSLAFECVSNPQRSSQKLCHIRLKMPKILQLKVPAYGAMQFADEAGNSLVIRLGGDETKVSTLEEPYLYVSWPYVGEKKTPGQNGKIQPLAVTQVKFQECKERVDCLIIKFNTSGDFKRLISIVELNESVLKSFIKCNPKNSKGIASCTMKVILPQVTNITNLQLKFSLYSDLDTSKPYESPLYTSAEIKVLDSIQRDTIVPVLLNYELTKIQ